MKKMGKLTLGISSLTAPGGVEIGPVQGLREQAGAGSSPVLSASSPVPGLASKPRVQLLGWAADYLLTGFILPGLTHKFNGMVILHFQPSIFIYVEVEIRFQGVKIFWEMISWFWQANHKPQLKGRATLIVLLGAAEWTNHSSLIKQ